tara:strand:+ start:1340 stop:2695 length:1356 start_codon:yes stop_codon:yes gene_type:complete
MDARRHQEIAENAREAASGAEGGADPVPVADKIGKVAAENQYIIFAENNHFDAYDNAMLITSDKVMQTMADGGVKHVMMEGMSVVDASVINAYVDGEITKEQLTRYFEQNASDTYIAPNTEFEITAMTAEQSLQMSLQAAENAKKHGIKFHGLNQNEGLHSKETMDLVEKSEQEVGRRVVEALKEGKSVGPISVMSIRGSVHDGNPDYKGLIERQHSEIAASMAGYLKQAEELYDEHANLQEEAEKHGYSKEEYTKILANALFMRERTIQDEHVAKNVEEYAGDDKVAIIYGVLHTLHRKGDLDSHLEKNGKTAVVGLYNDKDDNVHKQGPLEGVPKYLTPEQRGILPLMMPSALDRILGKGPFEEPDYELDYGKETWTERGKEPESVVLPSEDQEKPKPEDIQAQLETGDLEVLDGNAGGAVVAQVSGKDMPAEQITNDPEYGVGFKLTS